MKLMMILAAVAVTLMACGGEAPEGHAHGDAAADAAQAPQRLTHFGEKTELFVEFPALVVGQTATFVAHFTQLADFKPVAQGRVTVLLSGDGRAEERFEVAAPTVPGIFKVGVTPAQPGDRDLSLIVNTAQGPLTHELGPVTVFTDAKAAAAPSVAAEGGIPFSKEQQWRVDFATLEAVQGSARPSVTATATIRALPDGAAQMTAPVAGVLRSAGAFPRIGQVVKKGQVLLWLTPRLGGDTDYAALQATVSKARIALEAARRERARLEALFKEEAVPERRVFEARATEAMAEAEATAAHARLGGLSDGGGGVAMRAPIDGRIVDVAVGAGGFVAEGAPLFHIANSTRLWLEARVAESEMGRLGVPTAAAFWVDGVTHAVLIEPGKGGRLIAVGGMVDAVTRTVPVIFEFTPPAGTALRLGMMARAQVFAGAGQKAVLVPASAVQDESGTAVVYVQTGGESFERRIVQTGAREGDRIAIVAGIEAGQRVVSRGAYLIRLSTSKAGPAGHAH